MVVVGLATCLALYGCASTAARMGADPARAATASHADARAIRADIEYLASDRLEGRGTGRPATTQPLPTSPDVSPRSACGASTAPTNSTSSRAHWPRITSPRARWRRRMSSRCYQAPIRPCAANWSWSARISTTSAALPKAPSIPIARTSFAAAPTTTRPAPRPCSSWRDFCRCAAEEISPLRHLQRRGAGAPRLRVFRHPQSPASRQRRGDGQLRHGRPPARR